MFATFLAHKTKSDDYILVIFFILINNLRLLNNESKKNYTAYNNYVECFRYKRMGSTLPASSANMIIFGDSLSDIGNNTWIEATGTPITSLDKQGNKYIWVNYLSEKLFKQPAYYSAKLEVSPLTHTVSYAFASADTSSDYLNADWPFAKPQPPVNTECLKPGLMKNTQGDMTSACVPGLLKQIDLYLNDVDHKPNSNTLFFIWSGANDLFYKLPTGEPPAQILKTAITHIVLARNTLMDNGVSPQQIYVINLPDLSKTPYAIKYSLKLTEISIAFNTGLMAALTTPDQQHPGIPSSHIISMYDLLNDIVQNPDKFHLTNVTESCTGNRLYPLCHGYLFYDHKHPTAAMHNVIADYINKML